MIPIHDVMRAHVLQVDFLLFEELQGFINILQAVDTHTAFGGFWLWEAAEKGKYRLTSVNTSDEKRLKTAGGETGTGKGTTNRRNTVRAVNHKGEGQINHMISSALRLAA